MSLHKYIVPPPLALGVSPAPPPKPSSREKEKEKEREREREKQKEKEKQEKAQQEKQDKDAKKDNVDVNGNGGKDDLDKKDAKLVKDQTPKPALPLTDTDGVNPGKDQTPQPASPDTPNSPGSMIPEPPTPGDNPVNLPSPAPFIEDTPLVPGPNLKKSDDQGKDKVPLQTADPSATKAEGAAKPKDDEPEPEPEPLPPIRLHGPVPHRPLRTRLSLDPSRPYPPINTDPRGAYHKYAKFMQNEMIYIDVTKDGWLAPQWKEKTEREALARLRGEGDLQAEKEREIIRRGRVKRVVPKSAEGILLDLWNDLVVAPMNELPVDEFWARYDWSDPETQVYLQTEKVEKAEDQESEKTKTEEPNLEWTRQGMEGILATVGVQCSYETHKPLPHHYADPPSGAYLILAHNHFLLRLEEYLQWKPQESANQFELLVTSHHDRVFGNMIKAQQMEERKKKELAHREKRKKEKEEEARKLKENGGGEGKGKEGDVNDGKSKEKGGVDEKPKVEERKGQEKGHDNGEKLKPDNAEEKKDRGARPENLHLKIRHDTAPGPESPGIPTPGSNVQVHNGHVVKPHHTHKHDKDVAPDSPLQEGAIIVNGDQLAVAVPVHDDKVGKKDDGQKHEVEVMAAGPKDVTAVGEGVKGAEGGVNGEVAKKIPGEEKKDNKDKIKSPKPEREHDPLRDAELLAKMIQAQGGGPDGPIGIDDIKLAFKALEMAAGKDGLNLNFPKKEVDKGPLVWTWTERCEMWRWRNYEAGLPQVTLGGWEERDWLVFADDRGCEEFELEQEVIEPEEEDVHDWSC